MPKYCFPIALIPALAGCAAAQQTQPLAFEVASVRQADYALVEAKGGIKLQELPAGTPNSSRTDPATGNMEMIGTLDAIRAAGSFAGLNAPIENHTGLKGMYKLSLNPRLVFARIQQLKPGDSVAPGPDDSDAADSMSEILAPMGLRLERRKVSKEVVVIDHIDRTPSEN